MLLVSWKSSHQIACACVQLFSQKLKYALSLSLSLALVGGRDLRESGWSLLLQPMQQLSARRVGNKRDKDEDANALMVQVHHWKSGWLG